MSLPKQLHQLWTWFKMPQPMGDEYIQTIMEGDKLLSVYEIIMLIA